MARRSNVRRRAPREPAGTPPRLPPAEILDVEVTVPPRPGGLSITKSTERPSYVEIDRYKPDSAQMARALLALRNVGFDVTVVSPLTISVKADRATFERTFGTKLSVFSQPILGLHRTAVEEFYFPPEGAPWAIPPALAGSIDDVYIQWPSIYFQTPSPFPPRIDYHHLRVPGDVALAMNACRVHRQGTTGKGVKVAMVDTGFYTDHPYFKERGYNMSVALAPDATEATKDGNGHGTAECANIFAIAPDITFIGIKLDNESDPLRGASLAEGFKLAVAQSPDIITVSQGYDLVEPGTRAPLTTLPNSLKALEAEIKAAVQAGIIVIFSAGNGHVSFPGMMPEVISAGGTYVAEDMSLLASDYASAFTSRIYPGRDVPDVTGLVGLMKTSGAYIMLPLQSGCEIDVNATQDDFPDGTKPDDGWACISGTSAAAPQLAGVCALLKQKNPGLTPSDVKNLLMRTARDVLDGTSNPASNDGVALKAGPGQDGATGDGLVDAFAAWKQA